ncbi:hypothetical protein J3458_001208 [Metarhizium acridum]|uniref:uncharacterized protein n=1 Tax=Metarhizium acridum TaxID=92637 RepID=UPI001C6C28E7|nr:hypothetical protein J3458_001208 [Metarhizium acridum]
MEMDKLKTPFVYIHIGHFGKRKDKVGIYDTSFGVFDHAGGGDVVEDTQHREGGDRAMKETLPNPQRSKEMRPLWSISNRICITTAKALCGGGRVLAEDGVQRKWALPGWICL